MSDCVCGLDVCTDCEICDECVKLCDCNTCKCNDKSKCEYCVNLYNQEKLDYLNEILLNASGHCDIRNVNDISSFESFMSNDGLNKVVFVKSVNNNVTVIVYDYARCKVEAYDLKDFKLSSSF